MDIAALWTLPSQSVHRSEHWNFYPDDGNDSVTEVEEKEAAVTLNNGEKAEEKSKYSRHCKREVNIEHW